MKLTLDDMIVELASDHVTTVNQLALEDRYRELHDWLQPIFIEQLKKLSSESLVALYRGQLDDTAELDN